MEALALKRSHGEKATRGQQVSFGWMLLLLVPVRVGLVLRIDSARLFAPANSCQRDAKSCYYSADLEMSQADDPIPMLLLDRVPAKVLARATFY